MSSSPPPPASSASPSTSELGNSLPSRSSSQHHQLSSSSRPHRSHHHRSPPPPRSPRRRTSHLHHSRHHHRSRERGASSSSSSLLPSRPPRLTQEEARLRDARCVFVTQLQVKATEDDVECFFASVCRDAVREVALIREKTSGRSRGCGYVELGSADDVKSALLLSGLPFLWRDGTRGLPIAVRPTLAFQSSDAAPVIKQPRTTSTPSAAAVPALHHALFAEEQARVEFIELRGAQGGQALAKIDGGPPQLLPAHQGRAVNTRLLFVDNLDKSLTGPVLRDVFSAFGKVDNVQIKTDPATGGSQGSAYCRFDTLAGAAEANDKLNGFQLLGLTLKCHPIMDRYTLMRQHREAELARQAAVPQQQQQQQQPQQQDGLLSSEQARRIALMGKLGGGAAQEYLASLPTTVSAGSPPAAAAAAASAEWTPRVALSNMFDTAASMATGTADWEMDLERDTSEECARFGRVISCVVHAELGQVHVTFTSAQDAKRCIDALHGRWFDSRQIHAHFLPAV